MHVVDAIRFSFLFDPDYSHDSIFVLVSTIPDPNVSLIDQSNVREARKNDENSTYLSRYTNLAARPWRFFR